MSSGKANPCDPEIVSIVTNDGEVVQGRISHFATCPNDGAHRRPRGRDPIGDNVILHKLRERARVGFYVKNETLLPLATCASLHEADLARQRLVRVVAGVQVQIHWRDTGEVVTAEQARILFSDDHEPDVEPVDETGQAELPLTPEPADDDDRPKPNSRADVGY